ncbi:hypothetical protein WJX73_010136 [Symbiochloris irregularis]|uniref:NADP-dependent oxidoreductase domain-containing protein n=1 Tax=Symbiochloris irregularis TaxID=706552 RepID=A0AAW1P058_9CHLO
MAQILLSCPACGQQRLSLSSSQSATSARTYRQPVVAQATAVNKQVSLGGSDLQVSRIGLGTIAWGDPGSGWLKRYDEEVLSNIFDKAVSSGVNFIDTAEVYGYQGTKDGTSSESIVGRFAKRTKLAPNGNPLVVGTKFFTVPWTNLLVGGGIRLGKQSLVDALRASLKRLQMQPVPLYQVHFPLPTFPQQVLADAMAQAHQEGLLTAVGVCNYNGSQLQKLHDCLSKHGLPLASNQVKYSVLERGPEQSGLAQQCRDLNVALVAHSPLEQGRLTERYVESDKGQDDKARGLLKLMQFIGQTSGGKSVTQVALNYLTAKGAIPIPGCKSLEQLQDILGAASWELGENEVATIDERADAL